MSDIRKEIHASIVKNYCDELNRTLRLIKNTPTHYFYNKLAEETGEVAEVASAYMGAKNKEDKILEKHECLQDAMLEELADVINVSIMLAGRHHLSFEEVLEEATRKLKKKNDKQEGKSDE